MTTFTGDASSTQPTPSTKPAMVKTSTPYKTVLQSSIPFDRSPSPPLLPVPPTSTLTPGPRATALSNIFDQALAHTISTCSYVNFATCFPTPARCASAILESVHRQITHMIQEKARREFEEILEERGVVGQLGELERLIHEAKMRKERGERLGSTAPHMLPPETLYLAHLSPQLTSLEATLTADLAATGAENERLAEAIRQQTEEVEALVSGVETVVGDIESANEVFGAEVNARNWAREAASVDVEMR